MYLGWFDDKPQKAPTGKIIEGAAAYQERFHTTPRVVVVNETEKPADEINGMRVVSRAWIRRNNFWFGGVQRDSSGALGALWTVNYERHSPANQGRAVLS